MTRKVDIIDLKRRNKQYDPIPSKFSFGIRVRVQGTYKGGRFNDLEDAIRKRDRMFYLDDENATKPIQEERE